LTGIGQDRIIDPYCSGPRIWFQVVPEASRRSELSGARLILGPDFRTC